MAETGTRVWAVRNADQETVWAFGFGTYVGDFPRPGGVGETECAAAEKAIARWDAEPLPADDPKAAEWLAADRARPVQQRVNELLYEMNLNPKIVLDDGGVVWGCECWWGEADESTPQEWAKGRRIVTVAAPHPPEPVIDLGYMSLPAEVQAAIKTGTLCRDNGEQGDGDG